MLPNFIKYDSKSNCILLVFIFFVNALLFIDKKILIELIKKLAFLTFEIKFKKGKESI